MNEETEEEDVEIGMDLEHATYATKKDILQKTAQMLRPLATVVEKVQAEVVAVAGAGVEEVLASTAMKKVIEPEIALMFERTTQ